MLSQCLDLASGLLRNLSIASMVATVGRAARDRDASWYDKPAHGPLVLSPLQRGPSIVCSAAAAVISRWYQSTLVVDGRLSSFRYSDAERVDAIDHGPLVVEADADVRWVCRDVERGVCGACRACDEELENFIRS